MSAPMLKLLRVSHLRSLFWFLRTLSVTTGVLSIDTMPDGRKRCRELYGLMPPRFPEMP